MFVNTGSVQEINWADVISKCIGHNTGGKKGVSFTVNNHNWTQYIEEGLTQG